MSSQIVTLMKISSQIRAQMLDLISRATFILDKLFACCLARLEAFIREKRAVT
jgi:hypothetical protein